MINNFYDPFINWFFDGNPFKVFFRKHYCYKCGNSLSRIKLRTDMLGPFSINYLYEPALLEFTPTESWDTTIKHKRFYCPHCLRSIPYKTQTNLEDIDIIIKKIKKKYSKYSKTDIDKITIKKCFEKYDGTILNNIDNIEQIVNLLIVVELPNNEPITKKFPITRANLWERPYYFEIKKKDIIWWK